MAKQDDTTLFTTAMGDVKPVKRKARVENTPRESKAIRPESALSQPKAAFQLRASKPEGEHLTINSTQRVDGALAKKLKRGEIPIEARLDLHGLTQENALRKLEQFLERALSSGKRCICVVTGKGSKSVIPAQSGILAKKDSRLRGNDNSGVLRTSLPNWLNLPHINPHILMFTHAQPNDGGSGAFYVLLKKLPRA